MKNFLLKGPLKNGVPTSSKFIDNFEIYSNVDFLTFSQKIFSLAKSFCEKRNADGIGVVVTNFYDKIQSDSFTNEMSQKNENVFDYTTFLIEIYDDEKLRWNINETLYKSLIASNSNSNIFSSFKNSESLEEFIFNEFKNPELKDFVAFISRDPNHNFTVNKNPYYDLANIMNESFKVLGKNKISCEQENIFNSFTNKSKKIVCVSASTSFGKTWLSINAISKIIDEQKKYLNNFIYVVPNESIAFQVIRKFKEMKNLQSLNISDSYKFGKSNIIVSTPEKIYFLVENIENLRVIVFDETHEIFGNGNRSKFYWILVNKILNKKDNLLKIWFLGAFITKNNIKELEKICKIDDVFFPDGFKSRYIINANVESKNFLFFPNKTLEKNDTYDEINFNAKIIFKYFSTVEKCNQKFNEIFDDIKSYKEKEKIVYNNPLQDVDVYTHVKNYLIPGHDIKSKADFKNSYNVINGLKIGVAIYHSNLPREIRKAISIAIEKKLVSTVYITPSIIGGVDFEIQKLEIDELKISSESMKLSTFLNLAGRVGRYKPNNTSILSIVEIEKNEFNNKWVSENFENLKYRNKNIYYDSDDDCKKHFIDLTIEFVKKEDNIFIKKILLLDPRINPNLTKELYCNLGLRKKILKNIINFIDLIKKGYKVSYIKNSENYFQWNNKDEIICFIKDFITLYGSENNKFYGCHCFENLYDFTSLKIIKYFIKFLSSNLNENNFFSNYLYHLKKVKYDNLGPSFSEKLENFCKMFYKEIDYALISYLNHFISLCNLLDGTNISLFYK